MNKFESRSMVILDKNQLINVVGGRDNFCSALGGATLAAAAFGNAPAFMVFGAGFMIFCLNGHA